MEEELPCKNDVTQLISIGIDILEEDRRAYWMSAPIRRLVGCPEELMEQAEAIARAVEETVFPLVGDKPLPEDYLKYKALIEDFTKNQLNYRLRRDLLFATTFGEIQPHIGNFEAIKDLMEKKAIPLERSEGYQQYKRSRDDTSLIAEAEEYLQALSMVAAMNEDQLKKHAGNPKAYESLINSVRERWYDFKEDNIVKAFYQDWPLCTETPREEMLLKLVREDLYLNLSGRMERLWGKATHRIFELATLVVQLGAKPNEATLKFLRLVSESYILGNDAACVILCRAVIETAFRECVSKEMCEECLGPSNDRNEDPWGLANRIMVARKSEVITKDIEDMAFAIKVRGDTAVHNQPDATTDILGTVKGTLMVLQALYA